MKVSRDRVLLLSRTLLGCGVAALACAMLVGPQAPSFGILIVTSVDAATIAVTAMLLLHLFGNPPQRSASGDRSASRAPARSLREPLAAPLMQSLVEDLAPSAPVRIEFAPHDPEALQFARQIAQYVEHQGFSVVEFREQPLGERAPTGVTLYGDNLLLVGPND